jgi:WD40 repeat protein
VNLRSAAVIAFVVAAAVANAEPHLVFDHKIGTDWPLGSNNWMSFAAISSDGQTAAGGSLYDSEKGSLTLWSFPEGKFIRKIQGYPLALSPDFRYAALQKQILDLQTGKAVLSVRNQKDRLDAAAFSPNGELVAVKATPHLVKGSQLTILRISDGTRLSSFGTRFIRSMAFTADAQTIATGHWNNITLWDTKTGERLALLMSPPENLTPDRYSRNGRYLDTLAVSPDGKLLAAGSDSGELQVWDLSARKLVYSHSLTWASISSVAFSPDSTLIATGSYHDGTLRLVAAATGDLLSEVQVSMFGVGTVAFSPDGKFVLTPSNAGMLQGGKITQGGTIRAFRVEQ